MGQAIIVTMPDGQQVLMVPAKDIAEETVISEEPQKTTYWNNWKPGGVCRNRSKESFTQIDK